MADKLLTFVAGVSDSVASKHNRDRERQSNFLFNVQHKVHLDSYSVSKVKANCKQAEHDQA